MIRRWFSSKADTSVRSSQFKASSKNSFGQFEQLEDKRCLAFVGFFDGVTLTLEQTVDDGDVVVDNSGIGGAWRVTDNAATLSFVAAENVVIELLDDTANQIDLQINSFHNGSATIDAGHGPRDIIFSGVGFPGSANSLSGDINVFAGDSVQNILWTPNILAPVNIGGNFTVDTGTGFDTIFNSENFATVGGDVDLLGVNNFIFTDFLFPVPLDAYLTVGGNFTMDTSNESVESFFLDDGTFLNADPLMEERTVIGGDFTYIGGDDIDHVDLNNIFIQGNLNVDLGEGIPFFGDPQNLTTTIVAPRFLGGPFFELDGDAAIAAGDATLGNEITLDGYHDGNLATFDLGGLEDEVIYSWIGNQVDVIADLGSGDDTFVLNQPINSLIIDFGNDPGDQFINNVGKFTFDADLLNYHFFDHEFTVGDDTLELTQLIDTGDVTIDNTGGITGVAWRVSTPLGDVEAESTPANNLILNMLDNTGNNVILDLANPVLAFLTLNLGDGDRNVDFIGASNNPLRDISIFADAGDQNVELSVNAALAVATLNIDLGSGFDTVDDDANNLSLSEDLIFSGVNSFENDGILSVGRNAFIDTTDDSTESVFANNSSLIVAGTFTYTGGTGRDELRLNGDSGNSIGSTTTVDLGDNVAGGTQSFLINAPSTFVGGALTVLSSNADSDDVFDLGLTGTASVVGDIAVDLGNGNNTAHITGVFGGSDITYVGGDQVDTVVFGTTGNPANFNADLGQGDDFFTLLAGASIASPFVVNFGGNADTFINQFGPFTFDAELLGLNGFNHLFDLTDAQLTSIQIADQGDVIVDNNGTLGAIRFTTAGSTSEIAPVTNIQIDLLGATGNNLDIDWDNAYLGDLEINLGSGPRVVSFTGDDNSTAGSLAINAGSGDQIVNLATTNAFSVGGEVSIDLGAGADEFTDSGNDVSVGGDFTATGVNTYINNSVLTVGGSLLINNGVDVEPSLFQDAGELDVAGNFDFIGNAANDTVLFTSGGDGAAIGGNINLSLGGGDNTALLHSSSVNGTNVDYSGGDGIDVFEFGLTGSPVDIFASLGAGDDTFELQAGVSINSLFVNFGTGDDTFINNSGPLSFPTTLLGLGGFNHTFDPVEGTLTSEQVAVTGPVVFDNNGAGGAIQLFADGDTTVLGPATNLNITLLDNSGDELTVDFDSPLAGNLSIALGEGGRSLSLTGDNNSIGGALTVTAGTGIQLVDAAPNNALTVGAGLDINLGTGPDVFNTDGNALTVNGNATFTNVNQIVNDGTINIGGNLTVDNSVEFNDSRLIDNALLQVAGDLDFFGGTGDDIVILNDSSSVGGNIDIRAAQGDNEAIIRGEFGGDSIRYGGGAGVDTVTLDTTGGSAVNVNVRLGAGDDEFTLEPEQDLSLLRVDFGGGNDVFDNNFGDFEFNATLLDLDGFDAFYIDATGNLDLIQTSDAGDLTVDDNGSGGALRFGTLGELNELTPVNNLRVVLEDNSSGDVTVDFDSVRNGSTVINLRSADRDIDFTGTSNTFNGLLRIEAADGVQNVNLAEASPLTVTGSLIVNTRDGGDTVTANGAITVSNAFLLRGVNTFVNNLGVNVGGDLNVITVLEDQDTRLISNTSFSVGGNLTYIGGGGVDQVNFNDAGANIGGFTYIDIANSSDDVTRQNVRLTGGFSTNSLFVVGGTGGSLGNFVTMDANTFVDGGLVVVNFANSTTTNTVEFRGDYTGTYGTYRGGSASDFIVLAADAPIAEFAVLSGAGNDVLVVETTTDVDFLFGDLGEGEDSLDNQFGTFPFDNNIFNL